SSAVCDKCVLIDKHAMCVLKSVAKPLKKTVASESNKKPRNLTRKLYEHVSKTCSWWYSKFTPSGYIWKPTSGKEHVNPNASMPLGNASRTANVKDTMTSRRSIVLNTSLSSNSFETHRDCPIHRRLWVSNDDHYNVFAKESTHLEQSEYVLDTYPIEQDAQNVIINSLDMSNDREEIDQNDDDNDLAKEQLARRNSKEYASQMELECAKEMVVDLRYFNSLKLEVDSLTSQLETQRTQFVNEIDRLSRKYYYADHMNAILGVYTELDEVTNLQCDYLELLENFEGLETELSKSKMMSKSFESDLKTQLQDKGIVISELKKLIEKLKGKSVDTKFEKSLVIRQPNAFKSSRPSVLGKPTIFSNSFVRKDFSKSTSVTQTHVSNDFSKPVTAQTLPMNKKSILKNTNVLAPGMYKHRTDHTQTRTSQLPQDSRTTNKRVSFSTGVIPTTSVSRPQLKSNPQGDRVMHNNSQGKKQEVEDQRRSVKLSKNKTSVTVCNDSLNAKTLNVKYVSAKCDSCVLIDKHAMCALKSVAKPIKKTVASESNKNPRNFTRKLYEHVSQTCSWWYPKFTPSGYIWKPKSRKENVNPNVSMPLGNASRTANVMHTMTSMCSTVSNTPLSSNSFVARRDCPIHRRLWVFKAHDGKSQASN
nr:hypothetical protein [Tanacetum cinerariifolium]